ncbi:MAG: formylglycine-generating enzyme family protein [Capsulimonadaceae bacterium]
MTTLLQRSFIAAALTMCLSTLTHAQTATPTIATKPGSQGSSAGTATPAPVSTPRATKINLIDGAVMVYVPAGPFQMGDADQKDNPVHTVTLSGYYIYKNDVTVAMYQKFCLSTGRTMPDPPRWGWDNDNSPIVNVSWDDAKAYCDWAGVHLPTEAQWEKAARGTDGRKYPWGNNWDPASCRHSSNSIGDSGGPVAVGSYPSGASPYGVLDMAGNVYNWCSDWYNSDYWKTDHKADPQGPDSSPNGGRVLRGGAWTANVSDVYRTSYRDRYSPDEYNDGIGLRGASGP